MLVLEEYRQTKLTALLAPINPMQRIFNHPRRSLIQRPDRPIAERLAARGAGRCCDQPDSMGHILKLGQPQRRLRPFLPVFICVIPVLKMGCSNTGLALGCFWARAPTPVELALLCPAALQRWFLTLEPGLLGHGGTAQASNPAACGNEPFIGVFHSVNSTLVGRELVLLGAVGSGTGLGLDAT